MPRALVAFLTVASAMLVTAWLLWPDPWIQPPSTQAGESPAHTAEERRPAELSLAAPAPPSTTDFGAPTETAGHGESERSAAGSKNAGEVNVTIEVRDLDGQLLPPAKGTLHLRRLEVADPEGEVSFSGRRGGRRMQFQVEQGRASIPRFGRIFGGKRRAAEYQVERFDFRDREALPDPSFDDVASEVEAGGHVLRLRLPAPRLLHVLSRETGADLTGVEVHRVQRWGGSLYPLDRHRLELVAKDAASPVVLPEPEPRLGYGRNSQQNYLVHAPGHAWEVLALRTPLPLSSVAELSLGGTAEIVLDGPLERLQPELVVRNASLESTPYEARPAAEKVVHLRGLRPGLLEASLRLPADFGPSFVIASEEWTVTPGHTRRIVLSFDEPRVLPRVHVFGRLCVPAGWPRPEGHLELIAQSVAPDAGDDRHKADVDFPEHAENGSWRGTFEFEGVYPGTYAATFPHLAWRATITVPEGGNHELELELPAARTVRLEFLDRAGRTLDLEHPPMLYPNLEPQEEFFRHASLEASRADSEWVALCPPGTVTVMAAHREAGLATTRILVTNDDRTHRITLGPQPRLVLDFQRSGERASRPPEFQLSVLGADGRPVPGALHRGAWAVTHPLPPDQLCEVRIERPFGCEAVDPFYVDTSVQPLHSRTIELVPLR